MNNFMYRKKEVPPVQAVKMNWGDDGELTVVIPFWVIEAIANGTLYQAESGEWCLAYKGSYTVVDNNMYLVKEGDHIFCQTESYFERMYQKI